MFEHNSPQDMPRLWGTQRWRCPGFNPRLWNVRRTAGGRRCEPRAFKRSARDKGPDYRFCQHGEGFSSRHRGREHSRNVIDQRVHRQSRPPLCRFTDYRDLAESRSIDYGTSRERAMRNCVCDVRLTSVAQRMTFATQCRTHPKCAEV